MKSALMIIGCFALVACSHANTKPSSYDMNAPENGGAALPTTADAKASSESLDRYTLAELNGAANLLKVVIDQGAEKPTEDKGTEIIGCPLTAEQALPMMMPLKAMIDGEVRSESDNYAQNPKTYSTDHAFETCGATCSCGVWSDVVSGASGIKGPGAKVHAHNTQRLEAKAKRQQPSESLACARKQPWFCGSDLKAYLSKQATENAQ